MKVYIVSQEGPEWSNVMSLYVSEAEAVKEAKRLNNADKIEGYYNWLHKMSEYNVQEHIVVGLGEEL